MTSMTMKASDTSMGAHDSFVLRWPEAARTFDVIEIVVWLI